MCLTCLLPVIIVFQYAGKLRLPTTHPYVVRKAHANHVHWYNLCLLVLQGELAIKNTDLAAATKEAEKLLKEISENTAIAEKEKQKVLLKAYVLHLHAFASTCT